MDSLASASTPQWSNDHCGLDRARIQSFEAVADVETVQAMVASTACRRPCQLLRRYEWVMLATGIPRQRCTQDRVCLPFVCSSYWCRLHHAMLLCVFEWVYAVALLSLSIGWVIWHSYAVFQNNTNLLPNPDKPYPPYMVAAFIFPNVDGALNLLFGHYDARFGQSLHITAGTDDSPRHMQLPATFNGLGRHRSIRRHLFGVSLVVALRCGMILCMASPSGGLYLAAASIVEFLPHVPVFLLVQGQAAGMHAALKELHQLVLVAAISPEQCAVIWAGFFKYVTTWSRRWQIFITASTGMEMYVVVFQSIWSLRFAGSHLANTAAQVSCLVVIEALFISFKIWPIASFNRAVELFPNKVVVDAARRGGERLEAATTTSCLFMSRPPKLRVLGFAVSVSLVKTMVVGTIFSQLVRFLYEQLSMLGVNY